AHFRERDLRNSACFHGAIRRGNQATRRGDGNGPWKLRFSHVLADLTSQQDCTYSAEQGKAVVRQETFLVVQELTVASSQKVGWTHGGRGRIPCRPLLDVIPTDRQLELAGSVRVRCKEAQRACPTRGTDAEREPFEDPARFTLSVHHGRDAWSERRTLFEAELPRNVTAEDELTRCGSCGNHPRGVPSR